MGKHSGKGGGEAAPTHRADGGAAKTPKQGEKRRAEAAPEEDAGPSSAPEVRRRRPRARTRHEPPDPDGPPHCGSAQGPLESFVQDVREHSAYFDHLVTLVPAKYYLAPTDDGESNVRAVAGGCAPVLAPRPRGSAGGAGAPRRAQAASLTAHTHAACSATSTARARKRWQS